MPFLPPNQQRQSTEGIPTIQFKKKFQKIFTWQAIWYKNACEVLQCLQITMRRWALTNVTSSLCHPTRLLIHEQQTRGLPYVQCSKNRLTCENCIADYKIFKEHQRKFQEISRISRSSSCCRHPVLSQSCPWVHFVSPDPTQPISWLTQPDPTHYKWKNLDPTRPNAVQLTMELTV